MPTPSRLLRLSIILAASLACHTFAATNYVPRPAEAATGEFPFDNQSIPSASSAAPLDEGSTSTAPTSEFKSRSRGGSQCQSGDNNNLQKSLLVTAFPRFVPISSNAGRLDDAEHQLPKLLGEQLVAAHRAIVPVILKQGLPQPDLSNDVQLAQQIQRVARAQGTQLVLTGEIADMSMTRPEATYNPGLYTRFINGVFDFIHVKTRFDKRERVFSFHVNLRDGFTGQTLFSKRYDTYGIWGQTREVGFGSPLFWKSDYGQQIKGLVTLASKDVGEVIQCQPYIAQVDSRPGQTQILLQGGANNGLRSGDTLTLYQMVVQGSENHYEQHQVRLVNRNTAIELREVYPSHSVGVINGTTYLTGQFLAVVP